MGKIEVNGGAFHGVHRGNVGVYTHEDGSTYAGEHDGGQAHGYGVRRNPCARGCCRTLGALLVAR